MAFAQQLGRNLRAYAAETETQRLIAKDVADVRNEFIWLCEAASKAGESRCCHEYDFSLLAERKDCRQDMVKEKLEENLADLGFQTLSVSRL